MTLVELTMLIADDRFDHRRRRELEQLVVEASAFTANATAARSLIADLRRCVNDAEVRIADLARIASSSSSEAALYIMACERLAFAAVLGTQVPSGGN